MIPYKHQCYECRRMSAAMSAMQSVDMSGTCTCPRPWGTCKGCNAIGVGNHVGRCPVLRVDGMLGELTREAFAGAWRADVETYEMHADVARLPEVDRLLMRCVRDAAQHNLGDAIDSARSAAAACREVPALGAAVDRIVAILEAP